MYYHSLGIFFIGKKQRIHVLQRETNYTILY